MDDHNDFDSVSWRNDTGDSEQSRPSTAEAQPEETTLPSRTANGKRRMSNERAGDLADAVDLAGIGEGTLEVTVDSPIKENDGTKDTYVSYLVTTHSDFKSFQKPDFTVRRRFTDFVFLRNTLFKEYPACAIPPLPDKNNLSYVRGDRFSQEFTSRRAWSLHRFIKRLTLHPVLRRAPILLLFLETGDWNAQMRLRPGRNSTASETGQTGIFDSVADTFVNAFSKVHKPDKRFIEVLDKTSKLDEDLSHVEKIIARVARREGDLEVDYQELANNMRKLVPLEPTIEAPLQMFAASIEATSLGWADLHNHTDQNYLGSLRDMEAYIVSIKSLLKTREQKQLDFEALTEYLTKAASERDILASSNPYTTQSSNLNPATFIRSRIEDARGIDHEAARRERVRKLELRIEELTREVESAKRTSEMFDEEVVREVSDFERIKGVEFQDTLGALAETNMDFYKGVIGTWERFLSEMEEDDPATAGHGQVPSSEEINRGRAMTRTVA